MTDRAATQPLGPLFALGAVTSVEFIENGLVMFSASQIIGGLGISADGFAFAYTLYAVAAIFMLCQHQWLAERLGYRRFVLWSLLAFAAGALCCATATGLPQFAIGRVLQGLGGATFFTAGRMAVNQLPAAARPRGFMVFVGSLLGGSAIAPALAAALIGTAGWQALFWFGCSEALLVAWLATPYLSASIAAPEGRSEAHWGWLVWLALGVFGLQYAIQEIPTADHADRLTLPALALVSLAILGFFSWRQWQKERPLLDFRGLFQARYLFGLALYFGGYLMAGLSGFILPLFLQQSLGLSLLDTALLTSFGLSGSVLMALIHVALASRWPKQRSYMLAGLALYALSNWLLSRVDGSTAPASLYFAVWLCGAALPLYLGPVAMGTFSQLEARVFSHGYQVKNIVRQLGLSSSIAAASLAIRLSLETTGNGSALAAGHHLFLLLALLTLPLAVVVVSQRIFR